MKTEAEQRYAEGRQLFADGRYEEARLKFVEACAADRTINCPRNLAVAEFQLGRYADAATHLRQYFASPDVPTNDPAVAHLRKVYDEALAKTAHLIVDAPAGADVQVDGATVARAPLAAPVDVMPGRHTIATVDASHAKSADLVAVAGQEYRVSLLDSAAAMPTGAPAATTSPIQTSPAKDEPQDHAVAETPWWNGRRVTGLVIGGAGVLAMGVGLIFEGLASGKGDDAASIQNAIPLGGCPANAMCSALNDAFDAQHTDRVLGETFLVAGGVALAAGAAVMFWPSSARAQPTKTSWVQPYFAPRGGGLQLKGEF